jgi:NAD(P)-dependent dehydrogenase (short-subunit alcohol dehydrogenase family)
MSEKRTGLLIGGAAVAAAAGFAAWRSYSKRYDFAGKVVLVTGGSRGLGLVLARHCAHLGSRIAICARDAGELARAREDLESTGAEVIDVICDMTDQVQVEQMIAGVKSHFGRIDVLVNNAGLIQVGPLEDQTQRDFEQAMDIHFWGPFYAIQAVLPEMRERQSGRIINISSIGGKVPVPHLAPYCSSKFALAGLSSSMATELSKDGIYVTSVFPGLMRTGSHINALFKGQNRKEFAWFSIMNGSPLTSVSAESAARQIINASARGVAELVISIQAKLFTKFYGLFPGVCTDLLSAVNRALPAEGGIGPNLATGLESTSEGSPSILTAMVDAASHRNNELKPNESI